jgi:3-hydroxyisobutyrate dehydrogenase-like beta-hydroxyacid dehydrogenase
MDTIRQPVAFIGLGIMGAHMAGHILAAGHPLHVFNRTRTKADALVGRGAVWHESPGDAAAAADVVATQATSRQSISAATESSLELGQTPSSST